MGLVKNSGADNQGECGRRVLGFAAIAGLAMAAGLALIFLGGNSSRAPGVTVSFFGFTNQPIAIGSNAFGIPPHGILVPRALLLAKNSGSVAVELCAALSPDNLSTNAGMIKLKNGFVPVEAVGLPRVLKPGQSMLLVADPGMGVPWSTEVQYQRRNWADRFCVRLWNSGAAPLRKLAMRFGSSWWQLVPVKVGPFTNQPPLFEAGDLIPHLNISIENPVLPLPGSLPVTPSLDLIDTHYKIPDGAEKP
jgi:hypothetical protein